MTAVHRIVLLVVDHDNLGADSVRSVLENSSYPNHCIAPQVMAIDTSHIEWSDGHPLNRAETQRQAFEEMFGGPRARPQHDPGAHVYMREAIETLRAQRDKHSDKSNRYDELTIVARDLRDAYEWLWPMLWRDDPEFVPFGERRRES